MPASRIADIRIGDQWFENTGVRKPACEPKCKLTYGDFQIQHTYVDGGELIRETLDRRAGTYSFSGSRVMKISATCKAVPMPVKRPGTTKF